MNLTRSQSEAVEHRGGNLLVSASAGSGKTEVLARRCISLIGDGDCDWPAVMRALRAIDYEGWATAEVAGGDAPRLQEIAARMDQVLAS